MAERPIAVSPGRDFKGFASNVDPSDLPEGYYQELVNVSPYQGGALTPRTSSSPLSYDKEKMDGPATDINNIYGYTFINVQYVIMENAVGTIFANALPYIDRTQPDQTLTEEWRTIYTGLAVGHSMWFTTVPGQVLMGFNGFNRPIRWNGNTEMMELAGIDGPEAPPVITHVVSPVGGLGIGTYAAGYRYLDVEQDAATIGNLSELFLFAGYDKDDPPVPIPGPPDNVVHFPSESSLIWDISGGATLGELQNRINLVQLWRSTAGNLTTLYWVDEFGAAGNVEAVTDAGGLFQITSQMHQLGTQEGGTVFVTFNGTGYPELDGIEFSVTVVDENNFTLDGSTFAAGTLSPGAKWYATKYQYDQKTDDDLANVLQDKILPINFPDGSLSAYRYGVPPNWMRIGVPFKNRLWMAGNAQYTTGDVSITTGTKTLSGNFTGWPKEMEGRRVYIKGSTEYGVIASVDTTALIQLVDTYNGPTVVSEDYIITKSPYEDSRLYFSEADLFEAVPAINTIDLMKESLDDDQAITALMPKGNYMYVAKERHLHRLAFVQQPAIDTSLTLIATRGCVNPWCWAYVEDHIYAIDELGVWRYEGTKLQHLSEPIQDFWSTRIAWEAKEKFHVVWDQFAEQVLFFVTLYEDVIQGADPALVYPQSALVYDYRTEGWFHFHYPLNVRCSSVGTVDDRHHPIAAVTLPTGGVPRALALTDADSLADFSAKEGTTSGTVTSNVNLVFIEDSTAVFPYDVVGTEATIVKGAGKGQTRIVALRLNDTQLLMNIAWSPPLAIGDTYSIAGINYKVKTKRKEFSLEIENRNKRQARLHFQPLDAPWITNSQHTLNHNPTPELNEFGEDYGDNVLPLKGMPESEISMGPLPDGKRQPGFAQLPFHGNIEDTADADRWVVVEYWGVQGDELLAFFYIDMVGVNP